MNILPLICGLLIIFACLASTFLQDHKSLAIAEWSLTAAERTEREVRNKIEERHFRRATTQPSKTPKTHAEPSQRAKHPAFFSRRAITPPIAYSKLNLISLLLHQGDPHDSPIYPIAQRLFKLLYGSTAIIPNHQQFGWEKRLLDAMIAKGKSLDKIDHLADLFPEDPELAAIYYQMLKGTNQYDLNKRKGIPPLEDFIAIHEEKKENSIYFAFASYTLLEALFSNEVAQEIEKIEKQDWAKTGTYHLLGKDDLQAVLLKHPMPQGDLSLIESYLNFSKSIPTKKDIAGKDKQSGMIIKRRC
jgi:hypothetical protein